MMVVSYQYQAIFYYRDRISENVPVDAIETVDITLPEFIALFEPPGDPPYPNNGENYQRVDKLLRIYSATEVQE